MAITNIILAKHPLLIINFGIYIIDDEIFSDKRQSTQLTVSASFLLNYPHEKTTSHSIA